MAAMWMWAALLPAQPLAPEVLLLARIKHHMGQVLARQPNYTCVETIERSARTARGKRFQLLDALHLEVAVVEGKELFSWPGEREFKERDLRELAPTGAIGNGSFALHARSVFLSGTPLITYGGEEELDGRRVARYDYSVPQYRSGYRIRIGPLEGIAGYRGSFWNDLETLDLVRLDVETTEIPPHLPLKVARDSMRYARERIGEGEFLLPRSSEMTMEDLQGAVSRNAIAFSNCRQYAGESTLSFDEAPETAAEPAALPEAIVLPEGLLLEVVLESPLRFPGMAIGDEIEGRLRRDVKRKGVTFAPKGAVMRGNLALVEQRRDRRGVGYFVVAIQWREIAFDGKVGPIDAQLEEGGAIPASESMNRGVYLRPGPQERKLLRHRDAFLVRKEVLDIPRGLLLHWRTGSSGGRKP